MDECRCAEDGGAFCYETARTAALAAGDDGKVALVEWLDRSRRASGVPYHVVDREVLARVAALVSAPGSRQHPSPT